MVQEYVSPVRVHKYPFEMVMAAYERRFPNCTQIPVVVECLITEDSWSADDSQRHTTRRCQLNVEAPYLLKKMIGVDYIYFLQKNHLDLKGRVLEIEATNETFSSRVGVIEKCRYYVHPENSEWTCFEQSALLDVKNFFNLENTVEKIAMKQYSANIAKGKELIESFMNEVQNDGVNDLRPWQKEDPEYNRHLRRVVSRNTEPLSPRAAPEPRRHSQPDLTIESPPDASAHRNSHLLSKTPKNMFSKENLNKAKLRKQSFASTSDTAPKSGPSERSSSLDSTKEKSSQAIDRIKSRFKSEERLDASRQVSKGRLGRSKSDLKDDRKKVTESDDSFFSQPSRYDMMRSCDCIDPRNLTVADILGRWDGLLAVVVCAMVMLAVLSSPIANLGRRRE